MTDFRNENPVGYCICRSEKKAAFQSETNVGESF